MHGLACGTTREISSHEKAQHDAIYKYHMCKMNLEIKVKPLHEKWGAQMQVI